MTKVFFYIICGLFLVGQIIAFPMFLVTRLFRSDFVKDIESSEYLLLSVGSGIAELIALILWLTGH